MDEDLKHRLAAVIGSPVLSARRLSGGDISEAWLLETAPQRLFCKLNSGPEALSMFQAEKDGLEAISSTATIKTPEVLVCTEREEMAFLILEYIEPKKPTAADMMVFGQQLARLHNLEQPAFGWERDNFIGSLAQRNPRETDWPAFYARERLLPQLKLAFDSGLLNASDMPGEAKTERVVGDLCGNVRPSLVHGDLWGGNYLISSDGRAFLIDPAVYCAHSEVDLAMSRLFGGFPDSFYEGYTNSAPISPGFEERRDLYQLYYLLVHLNLFGRTYYSAVKPLLTRYFGPL